MIKLIYPAKKPRIKQENGKDLIFCLVRKRWLIITPEEWVRQNFLLHLTEVLNYPPALIAVEKQLNLGTMLKRFDIVVYDRNSKPFMLVECKEMNVALTQETIYQLLRYQTVLQANVLVVTNGSLCAAYQKDGNDFSLINDQLPYFPGN